MQFNTLRNFLAEKIARIRNEWKIFQSTDADHNATLEQIQDSDTRRMYTRTYYDSQNEAATRMLNSEFSNLVESMRLDYQSRHQPFELHKPIDPDQTLRQDRTPAPGIKSVPLFYHTGHVIHANPETSRPLDPDNETDSAESYIPGDIDFGPNIEPLLYALVVQKYPQYLPSINQYCRPAGTTNATFMDFNKEQKPSAPIDPDRKEHVFKHVFRLLDATPYLPLHFVDTQYAKLPLSTGTGYHNRFSFKSKAHAKYSHPSEYADKPTSKGYFYNATYDMARTLIHKIKETGVPFNIHFSPEDQDISDDDIRTYISKCDDFFNDYPTLLFTRNHISQRDKTLKVRPVYAVDELFLIIETMLTFPLLVQARKPSCCIMYGLETIRGSNHYLDALARSYSTFFTFDWAGYDQRLPRVISDLYYTDFLRRLIVINHGYQRTHEYSLYPDLNEHSLYKRMDNLLHFLHLWYNNMTFLSVDGYAYRRLYAGVPSGLYNTQYLDSFANLFIMIDAMIEFGFSDTEIESMILFVLGDDNSGMTPFSIDVLDRFAIFLEKYALRRYHMVLSKTKSVLTTLRSKIETLGYTCNYGKPRRSVEKLVAQLCYPEHGMKFHTMSSRAIGIAVASAGQDPDFHSFCKDVYTMFSPFWKPSSGLTLQLQRRFFADDESSLSFLSDETLMPFPSLNDVLHMYSQYLGPLSFEPKWNYAHFMDSPDYLPPHAKTMHEYELENNIEVRSAPTFATSPIY
jgi:hypothetical protein